MDLTRRYSDLIKRFNSHLQCILEVKAVLYHPLVVEILSKASVYLLSKPLQNSSEISSVLGK